MKIADRCRIHAKKVGDEGWYVTENVLHVAADKIDEQAQEITKLRLAIYRAVDHNTDRLERGFLQGIIAEFEPNVPDGG